MWCVDVQVETFNFSWRNFLGWGKKWEKLPLRQHINEEKFNTIFFVTHIKDFSFDHSVKSVSKFKGRKYTEWACSPFRMKNTWTLAIIPPIFCCIFSLHIFSLFLLQWKWPELAELLWHSYQISGCWRCKRKAWNTYATYAKCRGEALSNNTFCFFSQKNTYSGSVTHSGGWFWLHIWKKSWRGCMLREDSKWCMSLLLEMELLCTHASPRD